MDHPPPRSAHGRPLVTSRGPCAPLHAQEPATAANALSPRGPPRPPQPTAFPPVNGYLGTKLGGGPPDQYIRTLSLRNAYTDSPWAAHVAITVQMRSLQR